MVGREQSTEVLASEINHARIFNLSNEKRLSLGSDYNLVAAQRNLARHIARYPQDLRAHSQRILLAIDNIEGETPKLPGYLQDLFIVLGDNGKSLRSSLFELSKNYLSPHKRREFSEWLQKGDSYNQTQEWNEGSILAMGSKGVTLIKRPVVALEAQEVGFENVLEEVRSYLEYGQIEEARELLEQAMLSTPDAELEDELLNIYYYTRDADALNTMGQRIVENGGTLSEAWGVMQEISATWN